MLGRWWDWWDAAAGTAPKKPPPVVQIVASKNQKWSTSLALGNGEMGIPTGKHLGGLPSNLVPR